MVAKSPIQVPTDTCSSVQKKNHATFGPPKPIVKKGDLKKNRLEECIGHSLKEKNQMTSNPLDKEKKDALPLSVEVKKTKNKYGKFGHSKPIVGQGYLKDATSEECVGSALKEKNQVTSGPLDIKKNYEKIGPPKLIVDQVYLKDGTSEECVGSSLKEMNQMTFDPLFTKKKDAPPLAVPRKKKKTYAPQSSSIDKRVNWIISQSKGVTVEGDPIDKEVLKKYLLEIEESEGFYCSVCPGIIDNYDMPNIYPDQSLPNDRYVCPENYAEVLFLATLAVAKYNEDHDTYFKIVEIEHLNVSVRQNFITFSAVEGKVANKGLFFQLFVRNLYSIIMFSLYCCRFWRKPLKLIRDWSFHVLNADEVDLQDNNAVCSTFRAMVFDNIVLYKTSVEFCKLFRKDS